MRLFILAIFHPIKAQIASLSVLKEVIALRKTNLSYWQDFIISRLFKIESPATRSIKAYNTGDVPHVSSGGVNNGIVSYLEPKEDEKLEAGNCITVSPLDGSSFYQEDDFLGRGGAGSAISIAIQKKYKAVDKGDKIEA